MYFCGRNCLEMEKDSPKPFYSTELYSGSQRFVSDRKRESLLVQCLSGNCKAKFKGYEVEIREGDNFFVPQFMTFAIPVTDDSFRLRLIRLPDSFMVNVYPYMSSDFKTVLSMATPETYRFCNVLMLNLCFEQLWGLPDAEEMFYRDRVALNIVTNYLLMTFDQLKMYGGTVSNPPKNRSFEFANRFFKMLGEEKVLRRSVDYYAEQLHITPRYLFKICQENTGLTPKQLIDYQIIGNIKKLLLSTDWSIQQVADAMGFPDQASLGQFFKRNEGVSPLTFRKSFR